MKLHLSTLTLLMLSVASATQAAVGGPDFTAHRVVEVDRQEIVFVHPSVEGYEALIAGVDRRGEVVLLDSKRDGARQIADALRGRTDLDAIHIISHGAPAQLLVGSSPQSPFAKGGGRTDPFTTIRNALAPDADILLYGCNFARGEAGKLAVDALAALTGADIAASDDNTGAAALGGDWDLETRVGKIETDVAISAGARFDWQHLLQAVPGNSTVMVTVDNAVADGVDTDTLQATILDAGSNPVTGETVTFAAPTNATLSAAMCTTDAAGQCTVTATSTVAGADSSAVSIGAGVLSNSPANFEFRAGPADRAASTVMVTFDNALADGAAQDTLQATIRDANSNPVTDAVVTFSPPVNATLGALTCTTDALGQCAVTVTSTVAGPDSSAVSITAGALSNSPVMFSFIAGAADPTNSMVLPSVDNAIADGVATDTLGATIRDVNDNPVADEVVTFTAPVNAALSAPTCTTAAAGQCSVTATSTLVGTYSSAVSIAAGALNNSPVSFNFVPGPVDITNAGTLIEALDAAGDTDGDTGELRVTLLDATSNPVPGINVGFTVASGNATLAGAVGVTDVNGQYTTTTGNTVAETASYTVQYDSDGNNILDTLVVNGSPASVVFSAGAAVAAQSVMSVDTTTGVADGVTAIVVTVQAADANGNNLSNGGETVVVNVDGNATASGVTDNGDGTYTATVTNRVVETVDISATLNTAAVGNGSPQSVMFTAPDSDGDTVPDPTEDANTDGDNNPATNPGPDTDANGTPDYLDTNDDGDGTPTLGEDRNGDGDPTNDDTDGDGIPDYLDADGAGPGAGDSDSDGVPDDIECPTGIPCPDTDGDTTPDYADVDDDGDGLPTVDEDLDGDGDPTNDDSNGNGTPDFLEPDPATVDTDGDRVPDLQEVSDGTDPGDPLDYRDTDGDLVPDFVEGQDGTDPNDPSSFVDTDQGGVADYVETVLAPNQGLPPMDENDAEDDNRDSDNDGLPDALELRIGGDPLDANSPTLNGDGDDDGDGVTNAQEAYLDSIGIGPVNAASDFDRDGYPDALEVEQNMNPLHANDPDRDGDGVPDRIEIVAGADIGATTDSDADDIPDAREIAVGTDPLVAAATTDSDGDGILDSAEQFLADLGGMADTQPETDSDGDGITDAVELENSANPIVAEQAVVWIETKQGGRGVRDIGTGAGAVTVTARVGNYQSQTLQFDWSGTDSRILSAATSSTTVRDLVFDPSALPDGQYALVVSVVRVVNGVPSPASVVLYSVRLSGGQPQVDVDTDGVADGADGADGLNTARFNILQTGGDNGNAVILQAQSGVKVRTGSTARAAGLNRANVTEADIAQFGDGVGSPITGANDGLDNSTGINDFELANLPAVRATVSVVLPQATAIPAVAVYRKFVPPTGWQDFVEDGVDSVSSAPGSPGQCPPPGDILYSPGLTPGDFCVQLTITDAGPNDADGSVNGLIKEPGGVTAPLTDGVRAEVGASGPWWWLLLGLPMLVRLCSAFRRCRKVDDAYP